MLNGTVLRLDGTLRMAAKSGGPIRFGPTGSLPALGLQLPGEGPLRPARSGTWRLAI